MSIRCRTAAPADLHTVLAIYNEGIADRTATFETEPRTLENVRAWLEYPIVVAETPEGVQGFAAAFPYRTRPCYAGIGEFSVYVARAARGRQVGRAALAALIEASQARGYWKLVSRIFPENAASRRMCASLGFREVGVYERHGQLDGHWRDCVIVEKLIDSDSARSDA